MKRSMRRCLYLALLPLLGLLANSPARADDPVPENFRRENLVAWCIVPFDAAGRGPAERAAMLEELGIGSMAYDWRPQHVPTFEEEIREMEAHGIGFFAFWKGHEKAYPLFQKHGIRPQIWRTNRGREAGSREERIAETAGAMEPLAARAGELGCRFGLYNHGGWGGEPENLVAVCEKLHEMGHDHVGIVYNWHHGHDHIEDWPEVFAMLQPHLICLNLNGMNGGAKPKILTLSRGEHELAMLETVLEAGYGGPVGILDHRNEVDARVSLERNLRGLEWLLSEAHEPGGGGEKPDFGETP